jgi:hypothetical protein
MIRRPDSRAEDITRFFADPSHRMAAFIEEGWRERVGEATLTRYELPPEGFVDLDDAGMHVSQAAVEPVAQVQVTDLPAALAAEGVGLRSLPNLTRLRPAWDTSLHVSGIRLRNAVGWDAGR